MASKNDTEVIIGGKVITLCGYESEEYLHKVASYINNKIGEFDSMDAYKRLSAEMKATLLQLNIADDYFKAKDRVESLELEFESNDKEVYDLKHELISLQIKYDTLEEKTRELELKNRELQLQKERLESSLEDKLLNNL